MIGKMSTSSERSGISTQLMRVLRDKTSGVQQEVKSVRWTFGCMLAAAIFSGFFSLVVGSIMEHNLVFINEYLYLVTDQANAFQ